MSPQGEAQTRWRDPLVAEVRQARAALLEATGQSLEELGRRLRAEQAASGHVVTSQPPRPPSLADHEAA